MNLSALPHQLAYEAIAHDHNLDPEEVEALSRAFGNDFDSLNNALDNMEEISYENC